MVQRDYNQIAASLPVFCVSSRAYQQMLGNAPDDAPSAGFLSLEDTGIPQLQAYAKESCIGNRAMVCQRALHDINHTLQSLSRWISGDNLMPRVQLSEDEMAYEMVQVGVAISELKDKIQITRHRAVLGINTMLQESIYAKHKSAAKTATAKAEPTVEGWGAHKSDGGMSAQGYKAACRREGSWKGKSFNNDLLEPFEKKIATSWEMIFTRRLPEEIERLMNEIRTELGQFHSAMAMRPALRSCSIVVVNMLEQQMGAHMLKLNTERFTEEFMVKQRRVSRGSADLVGRVMAEAYRDCAAQQGQFGWPHSPAVAASPPCFLVLEAAAPSLTLSLTLYLLTLAENLGPGMFNRMKNVMRDHIEEHKNGMFRQAADAIQSALDLMVEELSLKLEQILNDIYSDVGNDYTAIFKGVSEDCRVGEGGRAAQGLARGGRRHVCQGDGSSLRRGRGRDGAGAARVAGAGPSHGRLDRLRIRHGSRAGQHGGCRMRLPSTERVGGGLCLPSAWRVSVVRDHDSHSCVAWHGRRGRAGPGSILPAVSLEAQSHSTSRVARYFGISIDVAAFSLMASACQVP